MLKIILVIDVGRHGIRYNIAGPDPISSCTIARKALSLVSKALIKELNISHQIRLISSAISYSNLKKYVAPS